MSIPHFDPSTKHDEFLEALRAEGCAIIVNKLPPDDTQQFADDLQPALKEAPFAEGAFLGQWTKRLGGLLSRSNVAQTIAEDSQILALMEGILGPNCDRIQINLTQATAIHPFQNSQYVHRDEGLFEYCSVEGEKMVNVMWALTDFTAYNGATLVVPGSNHWDKERIPEPHEIQRAEMSRGSVLIWLGSTLHAAGANNTAVVRLGAIISYNLGWLRQGENQLLLGANCYSPHKCERNHSLATHVYLTTIVDDA